MSDTSDVYSPFAGMKQCPLICESPSLLNKLPNFGVYSIIFNSLKAKDQKQHEKHFAYSDTEPIEYMWNSAVPRAWRHLTARPFLNLKDKKRDTLQFLVETQKYIHRIRKPQILDETPLSPPSLEPTTPAIPLKKLATSHSSKHMPKSSSTLSFLTARGRLSFLPQPSDKLTSSASLDSLRKPAASMTVPPLRLSEIGLRRKVLSRLTMREERSPFEFTAEESDVKASQSPINHVDVGCKVDTWRKRPPRKTYHLPFRDYLAQTKPS